MEETYIPLKYQ